MGDSEADGSFAAMAFFGEGAADFFFLGVSLSGREVWIVPLLELCRQRWVAKGGLELLCFAAEAGLVSTSSKDGIR